MGRGDIHVTDHALLRYLERVRGIDVEAIRLAMVTPAVHTAVSIGCEGVKLGCGARLVIRGSTITTVLAKNMAPFRTNHV